ncbi:MAG TPA: DHA2 family efflux MFS transporter permease subunit [Jatrophihabitantaceae bacterium]|nr:DHA2 family efflux MFS transporter permease subunit [Jatrophihabitantaceae bacterium]
MTGTLSASAVPMTADPPRDRRWPALVVIAIAQLMVALDATIVNIALPSAQHALGFRDTDRTWVVTAYTLSFAGLLLLGGRVADGIGRRRTFLVGLVGFASASALAGAAPSFGVLVTGRALQGGFAAMLAPAALSLIAVTFPEPRERGKAFGVYGAVASSGAATGLLLGGALTQYLNWRWCLYVNVVVALGALVAGRAVLPRTRPDGRVRVDVLSGVLATGALAALVFGCSRAVVSGWTSAPVVAALSVGAVGIVAFVLWQTRSSAPLLPLHIVRDRARAGAYLSVAAAVVGSFGTFLMLTYDFQVVLRYSPLRAGLAFLPLTAAVSVSSFTVASRLLPRLAPRAMIVPGLLIAASGLLLLSRMHPTSSFVAVMLPAQVLLGLGMGAVFTPAITVATSGVDMRFAGVAAAMANTAMQIGGSIGTAVLNTIAVSSTRRYAAAHHGGVDALVHGYATAALTAAIVLAAVAFVGAVVINTGAPQATAGHYGSQKG